MASRNKNQNRLPSKPGIGSRLKIPTLMVIKIVRCRTEEIRSAAVAPAVAALLMTSTVPTGPDKS